MAAQPGLDTIGRHPALAKLGGEPFDVGIGSGDLAWHRTPAYHAGAASCYLKSYRKDYLGQLLKKIPLRR